MSLITGKNETKANALAIDEALWTTILLSWGLYALPVLCGFVIRYYVAVDWFGSAEPYNDAADYLSEAMKIRSGTRDGTPFYWPPGNSYYLAAWFWLFGPHVIVARWAIVMLSTLQIVAVGLLCQFAFHSRQPSSIARWIWALYPPSVLLVGQPYSQHLAGLLMVGISILGLYWIKNRSLFAATMLGLCIGAGCLTRPSMMSVAGIVGLYIFVASISEKRISRSRVLSACAQCSFFGLGAGIVLTPTLLYNARMGGGYSLSTNNERNFFLGNNPYTPWYKTSHLAQRSLDELSPDTRSYLKTIYATPDRRDGMKRAAMEHIRQNPGLFALRTFNRACSFWGFDYLASRVVSASNVPKWISIGVLLAEAGGYCLLMLLAFIAVLNWRKRMPWEGMVWCLVVVFAYQAPYCLAFSGGTYHFPAIGPIVPMAAVGLSLLCSDNWKQVVTSRAIGCVVLLFLALQLEYAYFTLAASAR